MQRDERRPWQLLKPLAKGIVYWGLVGIVAFDIVRAAGVCLRVRRDVRQSQATLRCLQSQDRELTQQLAELRDKEGRELAMKKRLYLKKDERWLLFERDGQPVRTAAHEANSG
ncbi:MAG: hypothetical protein COW34_11520 [Armatimonadetes bacterium CG17_big_fil_post_rev_8_21_14_2_50_66_6]|nr:hypothetical protein [Armatimonadota bacterium]PIW13095.1 MAG: hypothetical protein COW34_11520 [Armatimonadetes bacterium CG17_big_fil_post_rev_8_21_14_2_50_66_6]PJB69463.1 MAG: hypothetical protein CO096_13155 [Armatimonadetes bacterium CG_4_9_14_3_um_filter_66_14]